MYSSIRCGELETVQPPRTPLEQEDWNRYIPRVVGAQEKQIHAKETPGDTHPKFQSNDITTVRKMQLLVK